MVDAVHQRVLEAGLTHRAGGTDLPRHLDANAVLELMDPAKDADGLHPTNLGRLVLGRRAPLPCTPRGIVELLRRYDVPIAGAEVVVVGRGVTVGRPLGLLLTRRSENATVTLCHTGTVDLPAHLRRGIFREPRSFPAYVRYSGPGPNLPPDIEDVGFVDLTERLESEGLLETINRPSFAPWTSRGRIYGIPHDVHPMLLCYRADIIEGAGIDMSKIETWEDFARELRPLMHDLDGDGRPDRFLLAGETGLDLKSLQRWQRPRLPIGGGDLIAMGLEAGPIVARTMQAIEREWVRSGFPADKEKVRALARRHVDQALLARQ